MTDGSPFQIPSKAQAEMREHAEIAAVRGEACSIEFPVGSGVWADYDPQEREIIRGLTRPEMELIHEMKSLFDATLYDG